MKNRITSITIILAIVILLPALFFSSYEIARMTENEKQLENTYNKQLDAILFSINLYSDDIISSWASKITSNEIITSKSNCIINKDLLSDAQQIKSITFFSYNTKFLIVRCSNDSLDDTKKSGTLIEKLL